MVLLDRSLAFLAQEVQDTIEKYGECQPSLPYMVEQEGVVLFVDISGFTALGIKYREECDDEFEATDKLSQEIMSALAILTDICLSWGGDVVKFAGDALLCTWKSTDHMSVEDAVKFARRAAYEMIVALKNEKHGLDLHGGIASGTLLQIHLGEEALRWHLVAGSAVLKAAQLLKMSPKGVILYSKSFKEYHSTDDDVAASVQMQLEESNRRITSTTTVEMNADFAQDEMKPSRNGINSGLLFDNGYLETTVLSYIPSILRQRIDDGFMESGEIMSNVATMFVSLDSIQLTAKEIAGDKIDDNKLEELNDSFISMTRILDTYRGQVRDILFDDKGCVFIAVFGVHTGEEMSALRCARAAREISNCVPSTRIGLSVGPCFSGLCGTLNRHVFVVMGNEVNQAARYMGGAESGMIIAGKSVAEATESFMEYEKYTFKLKDRKFECFTLVEEVARSGTYIHQHRQLQGGIELQKYKFIGRAQSLQKLKRACGSDKKRVVYISGPEGVGKSAIVEEFIKKSKGFNLYSATSFVLEENSSYFVLQQLVAKLLGAYETWTPQSFYASKKHEIAVGRPRKNKMIMQLKKSGIKYNEHVIKYLMPSIKSSVNRNNNATRLRRRSMGYRRREIIRTERANSIPRKAENSLFEFCVDVINARTNKDLDCMIQVEDLQWINTPSLSLLMKLVNANIPGCRFLFVSRPLRTGLSREMKKQAKIQSMILSLLEASYCEHIHLQNLDNEEGKQLLLEVLGRKAELESTVSADESLMDSILNRTKGHPTHLILLVEWLLDQKMLVRPLDQAFFSFSPHSPISRDVAISHIPVVLTQSIRYRLDDLPGAARNLLSLAAVGGTSIALQLLTKSWQLYNGGNGKNIQTLIEVLQEHGFIGSLTVEKPERIDYVEFKAEIYHDVIIKSFPARRLKKLQDIVTEASDCIGC